MGAEAGIDEAVLLGFGIEHRHLPARAFEREGLGRRMVRPLPAVSRIFDAAHRRRQPHAALLVEHAVVIVGPLAPDLLFTPIGRGADRIEHGRAMERRAERLRRIGIGDRHLGERHLVRLRIEDRHVVGRVFVRAVQRAVGVDRRIAPVRGNQIVDEMLLRRPFPRRDDDVALDACRPRRFGLRQLALGDPVGPVAEIFERHAAELAGEPIYHPFAGLA